MKSTKITPIKQRDASACGPTSIEMTLKYFGVPHTGPTVFEPQPSTTNYFKSEKQWMINFRVKDLQTLITELRSKGITVEEKDGWNSMPEIGTFASIHDPEGNPIELWQPAVS